MNHRFALRLIVIVGTLAASPLSATEHFVPEDSQFTRADLPEHATSLAPYHEMVISVLRDAFTDDVRARLIGLPSFTPEYALGIRERNGVYSIFHLQSQAQLWSYENLRMLEELPADYAPGHESEIADAIAEYHSELPGDYHDVQTGARCEVTITPALGARLVELWKKMLLETHYGDTIALGPDGTDYHFSMTADGQLMAGKVWNPPPESKTGAMISITETMRNLCFTGDGNLLAQLEPQIDALEAQLTP
ncbi:MAG: hypothetical protein RJB62_1181 [Pseudomonadota bacterium]|jgi:hypothetical protein